MLGPAIVLLSTALYLFYRWYTRDYDHWEKLGVPFVRPSFPFGNMARSFLMRRTIGEDFDDIYRRFPGEPVVGFFKLNQPVLMLRDPELIKTVLVKEFARFHDNNYYVDKSRDPITGLNPFFVPGPGWKILRAIIASPVTTPKLKRMVPEMVDACRSMVAYLKSVKGQPIEAKQALSYYSMDSTGKCAFGLDWNSYFDDSKGFRQTNTLELFGSGFWSNLAVMAAVFNLPSLARLFRLRVTTKEVEDFLIDMVKDVAKNRIKNGIRKDDYIQQLIDSEIGQDYQNCPEYCYREAAAHCMIFFLDSFETSSILFAYIMYELAANPQIQEKLAEEIESVGLPVDGLDYETLHSMELLDNLISETLRLHPPIQTITRLCTYPTTLKIGETGLRLDEGMPVAIPVSALHQDPQHFPQPQAFVPERFARRPPPFHKFAYLPFGEGPRKCTGSQFVLTQLKMGVVALVREFHVQTNDNTRPEIDPKSCFMHTPKNGIWLKFIQRE